MPSKKKASKIVAKLVPQKDRPWATVEDRRGQVERLKLLDHQNPEIGRFLEVSTKTVKSGVIRCEKCGSLFDPVLVGRYRNPTAVLRECPLCRT